jgi:signal transduction histidine kinase
MNGTQTSPAPARAVEASADGRDAHAPKALRLRDRLREANQALLARPRLGIRLRLVLSLALCLLLCCGFALASLETLASVRAKLQVIEAAEKLHDRSHAGPGRYSRARVERVRQAAREIEDLLRRNALSLTPPEREIVANLVTQAEAYLRSPSADGAAPGAEAPERLRQAEAEASRLMAAVVQRDHDSLDRILRRAEWGPLVLLGFLFVLFGVITFSFAKALVNPIHRFESFTARIAAGDFSLIHPWRRYRDEFTDLTVAVNQMLAELQAKQDQLVKGARLAAVGTLTSGIAHELNNPLNNVSITTESLMENLRTLSDEEKWHHLQDIYFETERASEIVRSLLDFTRVERPGAVPVDLADVLQSTFRLAQNELTLGNVTLKPSVPADLPLVRGSGNQLRQVFLNVLLNAIQAMPGGGVVTVTVGTGEADKVCTEIHDTGVGIPPEVLPRIFDPFFTTKEPGKGTGLGLSVSLGILEKLGGDIQVASEPGRGTTVHVCLPRAEKR